MEFARKRAWLGEIRVLIRYAVIRSYIAEKVIKSLGWDSTTLTSQKWVWLNWNPKEASHFGGYAMSRTQMVLFPPTWWDDVSRAPQSVALLPGATTGAAGVLRASPSLYGGNLQPGEIPPVLHGCCWKICYMFASCGLVCLLKSSHLTAKMEFCCSPANVSQVSGVPQMANLAEEC